MISCPAIQMAASCVFRTRSAWNDLLQVRERTYQKRHLLFQVTIIFMHGLNESRTSPITRPTIRGSTDIDMVGASEGGGCTLHCLRGSLSTPKCLSLQPCLSG
uniref:Uncharacterized protein n=1 Tax=Oryza brachyantha TaxID=4533 RepID=J3NBF2_ORYBR